METITMDVFPRDVLGKKVATLRRKGITPIHLYGKGVLSHALQADSAAVTRVINRAGHHIPVYLKLDGAKEPELVFVREVQRHPITNQVLHASLYRIDVTQRARGEVPITLVGEAPAVHVHRGTLIQSLHYISVECLPMEMPERMEIDISHLEELEQGIRVSDLAPRPGLTILSDPEELIVRVSPPRAEETVGKETAGLPAEEGVEKTEKAE